MTDEDQPSPDGQVSWATPSHPGPRSPGPDGRPVGLGPGGDQSTSGSVGRWSGSDWSADLDDPRDQGLPPAAGPGAAPAGSAHADAAPSGPPYLSPFPSPPVPVAATVYPGSAFQGSAFQGSAVPGPATGWGAPPTHPSRRTSTLAVTAGVGLLAGVLGGFGGSAFYDVTAGRAPTISLPDPVSDDRARTAGEVTQVAAAVTPSVVSLEVVAGDVQGTGSGFVIDAEHGYVLTNNHVISAETDEVASSIQVVFQDGTQVEGRVVGADSSYDLAVVKVRAKGLQELTFGDSDETEVGDPVVAIGAPLGLQGTVTTGIVSAKNRPVAAGEGESSAFINAVQTDAAINPGNSGGPLVNAAGHVIAVNSAIARVPGTSGSSTSGSIGLGFAIPSNQAQRTAEQLIRTGHAEHPIIGVLLDSGYTGQGVLVLREAADGQNPVTPGGPADRAGIEAGDVITRFNGRPVTAPDELIVAIRAQEPGDTVTLTIRRNGGSEQEVEVELSASSD